jgi:hypothetical protein
LASSTSYEAPGEEVVKITLPWMAEIVWPGVRPPSLEVATIIRIVPSRPYTPASALPTVVLVVPTVVPYLKVTLPLLSVRMSTKRRVPDIGLVK